MTHFSYRVGRLSAGCILVLLLLHLPTVLWGQGIPKFNLAGGPLELSGPANPWRFVNAVGERAGIWGFEDGILEGWVYPLKVFHDFNLAFQVEGSPIVYPAEQLIRTVRVHPQSVELQYSAEQFTVTETLFTPRQEAGFVILLEAKTSTALRVFVRFRPDLNLMWPGSLGGQTVAWNKEKRWMELSEPSANFSALVGSPAAIGSTAVGYHSYLTNEQPYEQIELRLAAEDVRREYVPIIVTAGIRNIYQAAATYNRILGHLPEFYADNLKHYADLDANGPQFVTPDPVVNSAMRWSRVSLDQLKVCNPYLPCGFVSGYGSSGTGTRPMYAWFFDEPTVSERAFLDTGSVESLRDAFRFLQKFQREDGKIPHELSQSAGAIDWFKKYPYAYIHSDTSLWYLIAMGHFYQFTGDRTFLAESWPSIRKAYEYCLFMLNAGNGLPQIPAEEWGSMETAGVASQDSAMAGEWIAALRAVGALATAMNDTALAHECETRQKFASNSLEKLFWSPRLGYYNYGVGKSGEEVTYLNPTIAYSAWYGSLPKERAQAVLERLATAQFLSDWGVRSMSLEDPRYSEASYQIGSAWPFMTVAPMLADFHYHNAVQGFSIWTSMTQLRTFNARGAMPESLSGAYYRLLDNGVPHQMFSELVAVPGLVDGVLGMELDVPGRALHLTPHLPPAWPGVTVRQFPFGQGQLNLELHQSLGRLTADLNTTGVPSFDLEFSPALPAGATVVSVTQQGKSVPFKTMDNGSDVHVQVKLASVTKATIEVRYRGGISVDVPWQPILEGDSSKNLRVLKTAYQNGQFEMLVEGRPELKYEIRLLTPWLVSAGSSAEDIGADGDWRTLRVSAPAGQEHPDKAGYVRWTVAVALKPK
jgi:Glycosyl-hydrolase family 116, catalytic region